MNKNLIYTALLFMGIMGILAIWVVKADTIVTEPYGNINYTLNWNENFNAQVITITNWIDTITILDRNLWANVVGTGCEDEDWLTLCTWWDNIYWYHFQWWNNYGFDSMDADITTNAKFVTTDWVERSGNYSNGWYYGDTFIKSTNAYWYDYWTDSVNNGPNHYDLWWGSLTETTDWNWNTINITSDSYLNWNDWKVNSETVINRRWPCPENFHVPSIWEWMKVNTMMWNSASEIHGGLLVPFAGYRTSSVSLADVGNYAILWSSSPYSASLPTSHNLVLNVDGDLYQASDYRYHAYSVRCFYDFYQPFPETLTFSYSQEFMSAYEFAYKKGITTMDTIDKANMNWKLTRIAMAKMLSQYAINVLWKKPVNVTVPKFKDVTEKIDADYDNGVTLAYQLWIMWINMPDNKFRPNDEVTRAEFATALSRMLYSTLDGKPYYSTHLSKLKSEWILKNDDYKIKELRGYVMIMLMRSAK